MENDKLPEASLAAGEISAPILPDQPAPAPFSSSLWEILGALLTYVLAWIWFDMFDEGPLLLLVFEGGFILLTELAHRGTPRPRESWVWLGCMAALTAAVLLDRCHAWDDKFLPYVFLHLFAVWWVLSRGDRLAAGESGRLLPLDALHGFLLIPFRHFFLRLRCFWFVLRRLLRGFRRPRTETLVWSGSAILAALLLFLKAAQLLSSADAGFGALLDGFTSLFRLDLDEIDVVRFSLSLPVGAYVFGLIAGSAREDRDALRERGRRLGETLEGMRRVPAGVLAALLGAFSLLYLAFFFVQGQYLFGAFTRTLPEGFVVAEYARQGFFELCRVMAVNFALLWMLSRTALRPLRDVPLLRGGCLVLLGESLLFAVIAASKLWLYIDCFGFTPRRLQSAWLITVLIAGCLCAAWSLITQRKSFRAWMIFGAVSLSLLCLY